MAGCVAEQVPGWVLDVSPSLTQLSMRRNGGRGGIKRGRRGVEGSPAEED